MEFAYFQVAQTRPQFTLELVLAPPPEGLLPQIPARAVSANSVSYDVDDVRWNDFHGKALSRYDYAQKKGVIWSADRDLLHELAYLMILSLTGKELDRRGFHKVHACGVRYQGRDLLVMLPSHGGKTTLLLELARRPGVELLSDDTPLVSPEGKVLPFPLRLGVDQVPAHLTGPFPEFKRQHHSPKFLIPLDRLGAPLAQGAGGSVVLVHGQRGNLSTPGARRLSPLESLKGLMEHMVVGVGLPLVLEFFVRHTLSDWGVLARIGWSRLRGAMHLWRQGQSWSVTFGRDAVANADLILQLARRT